LINDKEVKVMKKVYKIYDYDLWRDEYGYYVNNVFGTDFTVALNDNATDLEIIRMLKDKGFINKYIRNKSLNISGDEYCIYVEYCTQKTGLMPVCELRLVTEKTIGLV